MALCSRTPGVYQNATLKSHVHKMGPVCTARKRTASIHPEPEQEDESDDFSKLFSKERLADDYDDDNLSWLSSGTASPSSCFDDYNTFSLDEGLISFLSNSTNSACFSGEVIYFFDGSSVSPLEEASMVLENTLLDDEMILHEDLKEEEEVITWLMNSIENDFADSRPRIRDMERAYFWVSLVNLDGEDSNLISNINLKLEYFDSDFPSPSYKTGLGFKVQSWKAESIDDFCANESIFWPFDGKPDSSEEYTWDFFIMPPGKNIPSKGNSLESIALSAHNREMDLKKRCCGRHVVFGSRSKSSKTFKLKHASDNKEFTRNTTMPSRLGKRDEFSMEMVSVETENDIEESKAEEKKDFYGKSVEEFGSLLEEDFSSIETLLGLEEFDGHEGVDLEFENDGFSLDESLKEA